VSTTFTVATGTAATGAATGSDVLAVLAVFMALDDARPFFIKKWIGYILFMIDNLCETF
jgi:hypothetical protein